MAYPARIKSQAISLRKKGYSIKEVAETFNISKSTSSVWLANIKLDHKALERLKKRKIYGQHKTRQIAKLKRLKQNRKYQEEARKLLSKIKFDIHLYKLICAVLYWTEGAKDNSLVSFINSDPKMVNAFVSLLRLSFPIDNNKFRGLVHIHEYHNEKIIKKYWSNISGIPISQFSKSYQKPHTKKRKRANYKGSFRVNYYDSKIARELNSIYNTLSTALENRGVG